VRQRDNEIAKLSEDLKHVRSTVKSQETTINYFRKKVEEMNKQVDQAKQEKMAMQQEIRKLE